MNSSSSSNSRRKRRRSKAGSVLALWVALGLGLGLVMLAGLLWATRNPDAERAKSLDGDLQELAHVIEHMRAGKVPTTEMLAQADVTAAAPLIQAIAESAGAREHALVAYQAEIEAVGLKDGLAPENLAAASGRAKAREQLGGLRAALDALVKHDALVQARLDESLSGWLANQPRWRNETWRQQLLSASVPMADTMSEFFGVEKDMVNLIEGLLGHLDTVGSGVMLEQAAQQELVFTKQEDLRFYRATLTRLGTLGRTEQLLLAQARQVSEQYARRVGGLLTTGLAPAP